MARKKKSITILENVELRPQVIGTTYQRKNNFGRVVIIFIIFVLFFYYIDEISLYVNNFLGINTAETIKQNIEDKKLIEGHNVQKEETVYNVITSTLEITIDPIVLNSFSRSNNEITFNVNNNGNVTKNLGNKKYYLETYNEDKTLLERFKINLTSIYAGSSVPYKITTNSDFKYIVVSEKSVDDYPNVNLEKDENGVSVLTCTKGIDNIVYTFNNERLMTIKHTVTDSNVADVDYINRHNSYRGKVTSYNNMAGINATFNDTDNGYSVIIVLDLQNVNTGSISDNYYFAYNELAKTVMFEIQTYGFTCN